MMPFVPTCWSQAEMMREKENEKLAALELEGLVDFTPDRAL